MNWLPDDKEIFLSKLNYLKNYYEELKSFELLSFNQYIQDKIKRRAVERLLQLIFEVACDTNNFILSKRGITAESYYDSFLKMGEAGIIEKDIASKLARTTGLRNRIIHEYGDYKDEVVYKNISIFIEFYGKYLKILASKFFLEEKENA
ncbi:MAG: type VII toxin-antitoxin system HepT family RNase toxin [Candidatus Brocadia sp.]